MFEAHYPYEVPAEGEMWLADDADSQAGPELFELPAYYDRLEAKFRRMNRFTERNGKLIPRKDKTVHARRWRAERGDRTVEFDPSHARDWFLHGRDMRHRADANYVSFLVEDGIVEYNRMVVEGMMGDLASPDAGKDVDKTSNVAVSD